MIIATKQHILTGLTKNHDRITCHDPPQPATTLRKSRLPPNTKIDLSDWLILLYIYLTHTVWNSHLEASDQRSRALNEISYSFK